MELHCKCNSNNAVPLRCIAKGINLSILESVCECLPLKTLHSEINFQRRDAAVHWELK